MNEKMIPNEIKRLVNCVARKQYGVKASDITKIGYGISKEVYSFKVDCIPLVALISKRRQNLKKEFFNLMKLHSLAKDYLPEPLFYFKDSKSSKELYVTRLFYEQTLEDFYKNNFTNQKQLAFLLGQSISKFNLMTGHYLEEPHNGNIFVKKEFGRLSLKFCDPDQIKEGGLEDAVHFVLNDPRCRPECYRFIDKFRKGLAEGIRLSTGKSHEEAYDSLDFIKKYNDIF